MEFKPTELDGVVVIEPRVYADNRGFFAEVYHQLKFQEGGIDVAFVQDNRVRSARGILRGLHAQVRRPQGKLVSVTLGEIFDVAVDIRRGSPTFGRWVGEMLTADNLRMMYIPPGFAHGYCVTSDAAEVAYKCTELYDPGGEIAIAWDDPAIGVAWPLDQPTLSAKDANAPRLSEIADSLPAIEIGR